MEVLFSARPAKVGAYEKLAEADTPDWRLAPVKTPWWKARQPTLGDVTIRFIDARTGVEAYRATASGRSDMGKTASEAAAKFSGRKRFEPRSLRSATKMGVMTVKSATSWDLR